MGLETSLYLRFDRIGVVLLRVDLPFFRLIHANIVGDVPYMPQIFLNLESQISFLTC